jgi:hypothetical protein
MNDARFKIPETLESNLDEFGRLLTGFKGSSVIDQVFYLGYPRDS